MHRIHHFARILLLLFIVTVSALTAQGAPEQIQDALARFNQDTGLNLTLNDLYWSWEQITGTDSSLGCPLPGESYTQGTIVAYRFEFIYQGNIYEYRVSADRSIVRSCGSISQNAPTATPSGTVEPDARSNRLCPPPPAGISYLHTRLTPGIQGRVPTGGASRVRAEPSTTAQQIGELGQGTAFEVLSGPACDIQGYVWWQISAAGGLTGWLAEGLGADYYVEPLPPAAGALLQPLPFFTPATIALVAELDLVQGNFSRVVAFTPDNRLLTTGDTGGEGAWIYDTITSAPRLLTSALPLTTINTGTTDNARIVSLLGGEDGAIRLWDLAANAVITERVYLLGHDDPVTATALKPDGTLMASTGGFAYTATNNPATDTFAILIWDVRSVTLTQALRGHAATVVDLAFLPGGNLISGSTDGAVRVWDVTTGATINAISTRSGLTGLAVSRDGSLAVAGYSDGAISVIPLSSLIPGPALTAHTGSVTDLAFTPDGAVLATAGADGKVVLWDRATLAAGDNRSVVKILLPGGHTGAANSIAFNGDGTLLASIGADHRIRLWGVRNTAG